MPISAVTVLKGYELAMFPASTFPPIPCSSSSESACRKGYQYSPVFPQFPGRSPARSTGLSSTFAASNATAPAIAHCTFRRARRASHVNASHPSTSSGGRRYRLNRASPT